MGRGGENSEKPNTKPNLVLCLGDCLRRDYFQRSMPRAQDILSKLGVMRFERHFSTAHCSDPSISSLLCGMGPWSTKITTQMSAKYTKALPTLFWRWKRDVGGGTCSYQPIVVPEFYRAYNDEISWHKINETSDLELRAVKAMTASVDKPFLLWLRLMDTHWPYNNQDMPPRGTGGVRKQYEEAVEHLDKFVFNLIQFINAKYPNTIIVFCADHGELLGEKYGDHGEQWDHLWTLHNTLVKVPMVVYVPGLKAKKTNRPTQHIDLLPTICDLLGLERQGEGVSWANWMTGKSTHPSPADRVMWMQGTGAGPLNAERQAKTPNLDPGFGRQVWRHRGVVKGSLKLVEDWHAEGQMVTHATNAKDYKERKDNKRAEKLREYLPPIPDYHPWEKLAVFGDAKHKTDEEIILERLKALGYA